MNDLISRQAAIDAIYRCTDIYVGNLPIMVDKEDAYKAIAQLPSAEPERKTGYWIYIPEESEKHIEKIYRCSACNNNDAWGATELTKYCSCCGAKMIGVKEDEEKEDEKNDIS